MTSNIFHFTISPVQSFVAQARRTRDLWAGSYILSYLSGVALQTVEDAPGGEILFPSIDDDLMFQALNDPSSPAQDDYKEVGSLPNRFKAGTDDPKCTAELAAIEVNRAWEHISKAVWDKLALQGICLNDKIRKIWDRQVSNQWEISWAVGDEGYPIEKRKNIRLHLPEDEPGEKCTICGERQALSPDGEEYIRSEVSNWWKAFAIKFNGKRGFHFRDDGMERLCAVCTIKRLFPLVTKEAILTKKGSGWEVPTTNYPSTPFMSAVPWLISILKKARDGDAGIKNALKKFVKTADDKQVQCDEMATKIETLERLLNLIGDIEKITKFRGDVFFEDRVKNEKEFKFSAKDRAELLSALKGLYEAADSKPHPYYALLVMDGDNMGALLSKYKDGPGKITQKTISDALSEFNQKIKEIVDDANGKLIFGGGDDVMALLPVETALGCAKRLRDTYVACFKAQMPGLKKGEGTISAGLIYAHMTTPLQAVVRDAHRLLDDKAKDETGRDAFAVRVWKRGGPVLEFSRKWEVGVSATDLLMEVKEMFAAGEASSGLIFRFSDLRHIMEGIPDPGDRIRLLASEYLKSREELDLPDDRAARLKEAEKRMKKVYDLSLAPEGKPEDAALLFIKFLNQTEKNP